MQPNDCFDVESFPVEHKPARNGTLKIFDGYVPDTPVAEIVTVLPAPPSAMMMPVPAVRALSFARDAVADKTTYDALGSPPPPLPLLVAVEDIVTCPLLAETIETLVPATKYDNPLERRVKEPENPCSADIVPEIERLLVKLVLTIELERIWRPAI
jgi:hypothetical protein